VIRQSGADYLIALKPNQPHLFDASELLVKTTTPHSTFSKTDHTHGRVITRTVRVFAAPAHTPFCDWCDLAAVVSVHRYGTRRGKPFAEHMFYITSRLMEALVAAEVIRGHWQVENGLHWVKDVILEEDACTTHTGNAPQNLALLRSLTLTLYRLAGHRSIKNALRCFAHDISAILHFLE
jgi:predicted transposase YbfD/YdcC